MMPDVDRVVAVFENLAPRRLGDLASVYAADACFVDPFNDVQGLDAIERIFRHMYATLDDPRFVITGRVTEGAACVLTWEFRFCFRGFRRGIAQTVLGASHLTFDQRGLICRHHDYWDAAHGLYEKMPLIGGLMRWLRRRASS